MNLTVNHFLYLIAAYLIGAIPFGWLIVKLLKNKDIRYIASGRMGMSNVMRVAGTFWGIVTAVLDVLKGYAAVKIAPLFVPVPEPWLLSIGGILAVLGHIYSVFLIEKRRDGKFYLRGGAGGLTSAGAAVALWRGFWFAMPVLSVMSSERFWENVPGGACFTLSGLKFLFSFPSSRTSKGCGEVMKENPPCASAGEKKTARIINPADFRHEMV